MKILSIAILLTVLTGVTPEKININNAPLEDLVKIIHIGEARAKELISLRPFSSLDDLSRINGIGSSRINDIKKQGLAWTDESYETKPLPNKELAAIESQLPSKPFFPLFAPILIAIFSGAIVLMLKNKLK